MMLGKVVGSVVATRKDERLVGQKLLLVEPLVRRSDGTLDGDRDRMLVSVDVVGAGRGETVLLVSGSTARAAVSLPDSPIDACIIGIVDEVDLS